MQFGRVLMFGAMLLMVMSCSNRKQTTQSGNGVDLNKKTAKIVEELLSAEAVMPKTLTFKANVEIISPEKNTSIKANVRMAVDSVIWMSITAYGYEVARVLCTVDSVKFINRTDKEYYAGDYSFLTKKLGVEFSFDDLQRLVLGQSMGLIDVNDINRRNAKNAYVLSTINKGKLKRMEKGRKDFPSDVEVLFSNWIDADTYRVKQIQLLDIDTQNKASIQYLTFENIQNYLLLSSFKMNIIAEKSVEINSQYQKIEANQELNIPFKISSKYAPIQ